MFSRVKSILKAIFFEEEYLSLTRTIAFGGYLLFVVGSLYLLVHNIDWAGYSTFAGYTGGGGAALQFGNKFINSKYNSINGGYDANKLSHMNPPNNTPVNNHPDNK